MSAFRISKPRSFRLVSELFGRADFAPACQIWSTVGLIALAELGKVSLEIPGAGFVTHQDTVRADRCCVCLRAWGVLGGDAVGGGGTWLSTGSGRALVCLVGLAGLSAVAHLSVVVCL